MPIIRSPRTAEDLRDIEEAWRNHSTVRTFTSGVRLGPGGSGYVYLMKAENDEYKIGRSWSSSRKRLRALRSEIGMEIERLANIPTDSCAWAEDYLQNLFHDKWLHGEWFDLSQDDVDWICSLERLDMAAQGVPA